MELALGDGVAEAEEVKVVVRWRTWGAEDGMAVGQKMILELRGTRSRRRTWGRFGLGTGPSGTVVLNTAIRVKVVSPLRVRNSVTQD